MADDRSEGTATAVTKDLLVPQACRLRWLQNDAKAGIPRNPPAIPAAKAARYSLYTCFTQIFFGRTVPVC
jgi:hypothetical protein